MSISTFHNSMNISVRKLLTLILLSLCFSSTSTADPTYNNRADDAIPVIVGGYVYEPFIENSSNGLTQKLIAGLNSFQDKYRFSFQLFPARRRYSSLKSGSVDMIFFESALWGWEKSGIRFQKTRPIINVNELLVSHKNKSSGKNVFSDLEKRRIAVINGYHYAFADFESNSLELKKKFDIELVHSLSQVLALVLKERVEIGVLNDIFLELQYKSDPNIRQQLVFGPKPDKTYQLPIIVGPSSPLTTSDLQNIIDSFIRSGKMGEILPHASLIH